MANDHSNQGYLPDSYRVPSHSNGAYNHIYTTTTPHRTTSRAYASSSYANSSSAASSSSSDGDDDVSDTDSYDSELLELQAAEREWEENVRQLQLAVSVLILPTIGKWLGRRWSYFCRCSSPRFTSSISLPTRHHRAYAFGGNLFAVYARYIKVGWSWSVLLPETWLKRSTT